MVKDMTPKWGVCIVLSVWLVFLPCQTLMPALPSPLVPGFSGLPCTQASLNDEQEAATGFLPMAEVGLASRDCLLLH
uniref:Mr_precursor_158 n=1 Tax=Conus marmoreus TaxID=42752 RepID=U6C2F4_CONMR|nr:Mr_precursor_158 [Conus marmoreus]